MKTILILVFFSFTLTAKAKCEWSQQLEQNLENSIANDSHISINETCKGKRVFIEALEFAAQSKQRDERYYMQLHLRMVLQDYRNIGRTLWKLDRRRIASNGQLDAGLNRYKRYGMAYIEKKVEITDLYYNAVILGDAKAKQRWLTKAPLLENEASELHQEWEIYGNKSGAEKAAFDEYN